MSKHYIHDLGARLLAIRASLGQTQEEQAESLGIHATTLSRWANRPDEFPGPAGNDPDLRRRRQHAALVLYLEQQETPDK